MLVLTAIGLAIIALIVVDLTRASRLQRHRVVDPSLERWVTPEAPRERPHRR